MAPTRRIDWRRCADEPSQRCGVLLVPRDWAHPNRHLIELAVRKLSSTASNRSGIRTLFINPGGPGEPGTGFLSFFEDNTALRRHFDLVSWDPRGVPASGLVPRDCPIADLGGWSPQVGVFAWQGIAKQVIRARTVAATPCVKLNRALLARLGTWQVARDLEALRVAVGGKSLTYLGYSYGTTIGRVYSQLFPTRVRAMLLDGVTSPVPTFANQLKVQRRGGNRAWEIMWKQLSPDYRRTYRQIVARLQATTIDVDGVMTDRWLFWSQAIGSARFSDASRLLQGRICFTADAAAIDAPQCDQRIASSGFVDPGDTTGNLRGRSTGTPIVALVDCADRSGRPSASQLARAMGGSTPPETASLLLKFPTTCEGWPEPRKLLTKVTSLHLRTAPLLINSVGDIATPWSGARQTNQAFVGSKLVSVAGTQHGLFALHGTSASCVNRIGLKYLVHTQLPVRDRTCPAP